MKPCIKLTRPDGTSRVIAGDGSQSYTLAPGEKRSVDPTCGGTQVAKLSPQKEKAQLLQELDQELGSGAGDWIKVLAKPIAILLNKQNCMSCEVRRVVVNAYAILKAKHGRGEAGRMMKQLWQKSLNGDSETEVLQQLKEWVS